MNQGFSEGLAAKFASPEIFLDFITEVLTKPYTIKETIEGVSIDITVDVSQFFKNPYTDLKKIAPKHKWRTNNYIERDSYEYEHSTNRLYVYSNNIVNNLPAEMVTSIVDNGSSSKEYILDTSYNVIENDINYDFLPVDLIDNTGAIIEYDVIDSLVDSEVFLPCFDDYTFNNIFPGMTRDKWIKYIYAFDF